MKTKEQEELFETAKRVYVLAKLLTMCGYGKVVFSCKKGKEDKK